ncbi:MAG: cell division protein FtsA [Solobacterium sp.]|nr:cell division protein FtsA [Solobacterium sp.]MCH4205262.1 cell division protein FtsA [Solobacterium sp.]MCH4226855.1 cell division protein FtsA [Solobacterium sp.]MCH4281615.1 cell division protein FtsA [Solobacterium sp.]
MSNKQIFAAVEVADHEVRLVVGEFFNTRFNIIKVEKVPCFGLSFNEIENPTEVTQAIRTAADNAKKMIGADIKKVILSMPSYRFRKFTVRSTVDIKGIDQCVTIQDVREAVKKAQNAKLDESYALIQALCIKYTVNGVSSRRIPLGEHCTQMSVDIDLLCADRKLSFDLVSCVENAGLNVLDIFPDVYAAGKEAALFEQKTDSQVIILKIERSITTLGLAKNGRLATAAVMPAGIGAIASSVCDTYGISSDTAVELMKYSARLDQKVCSTNPVYIWADGKETKTINEQQLVDCLAPNIDLWLNSIEKTCVPILQAGETTVMITGEGGETQGLCELVQKRLGVETTCYIPETLGGRNAGLTACLGLFYAYQDKLPIEGSIDDSLDMDAFTKAVSYREKSSKKQENGKEDTLTNKLKGLFLEGKK